MPRGVKRQGRRAIAGGHRGRHLIQFRTWFRHCTRAPSITAPSPSSWRHNGVGGLIDDVPERVDPDGVVGGFWPHPDDCVALHVAPSITDTVLPGSFDPPLAAYTVSVLVSTAIPSGLRLSLIVLTALVQPAVVAVLQPAASITKTAPTGNGLATYRVPVAGSNASAPGKPVSSIVAQRGGAAACHRRVAGRAVEDRDRGWYRGLALAIPALPT